ncbi:MULTISPECIES: molecular chaperone [Rubrivivax]|uniref:Molecular chaperone TorD family protein n=1 Tax=Rubrivivax benzoatilyticus TaxID=316997 RepID=A0ABX0HPC6_9BURK|nr:MULTISPECIES: molecular chaperone TorD family protein [Rubrivivax]MCD0418516.1 molecular chaperone TorD family protein [Rubrivivax sp. JA1024]MCC9598511.1 molecular chaperone TorD family protein [Rubrivivax sp. JA1055]MCC9648211.1 molecular chaperone TorD family protein [Rubrivivax sp. JA1029]NHK96936.1 molecular chaperone TorD family protein [Rubrivivax benzoatilyticus]NHL24651.1 molecular chaperone TorD family protein [Rubrivivax benzoatilyticus]
MSETTRRDGDEARKRAALWGLLARVVIERPTPQWLDELEAALGAADGSRPLAPQLGALLAALRKSRRHPGGATVLAVDRTRLLSMVMHGETLTAPCESAALGVAPGGDRVLDVLRSYREAGFEPMALLGAPDHLGNELQFVAHLCRQEGEALAAGDDAAAQRCRAQQLRFLSRHLMAWVPAHCEQLAAKAATGYYAAAATLIGRACKLSMDEVDPFTPMAVAA